MVCLRRYGSPIKIFKSLLFYKEKRRGERFSYVSTAKNLGSLDNAVTYYHCVKSVQIPSFFLVRISAYSYWVQENTDQKKLRIWTLLTQCIVFSLKMRDEVKVNLLQNVCPFSFFGASKNFVKSFTTFTAEKLSLHVFFNWMWKIRKQLWICLHTLINIYRKNSIFSVHLYSYEASKVGGRDFLL